MILPNGNSKKYIKTIIGLYILYIIVSPVISFATGHELELDYSIYDKYFSASNEYKSVQNDFEDKENKYIENTYKEEIKKQIKKTINDFNYSASNIDFNFDIKSGKISNLNITVNDKEEYSNIIHISKVEIGNTIKKQQQNNLTKQEIEKIKNRIQDDYGIAYDEIRINSI